MSAPRTLAAILLSLSLSSCASNSTKSSTSAIIDSLRLAVDTLRMQVSEMALDRYRERYLSETATLTPADEGYSTLKMDFGTLTLSLQNVEAYATGSRVTLRIGNTTSASINDARVRVQWGNVDSSGLPDYSTAKSRNVTFSKALAPGSWTILQLVLDGVPPNVLGFVRLSDFTNEGITLLR